MTPKTLKKETGGMRLRLLQRVLVPVVSMLAVFPECAMAAPPVDLVESSIVRVMVGGGHGTGWIVSPAVVATNWHVTDGHSVFAILPAGSGEEYRGELIWQGNDDRDVALIGVQGLDLAPFKLFTDDAVRGSDSYTVGFPGLGDDFTGRANTSVSVYGGTVALIEENTAGVRIVQHTNIVNAGNSGGPLMDDCARVMGLTSWGMENQAFQADFIWASVHVSELTGQMDELGIPYQTDNTPCESSAGSNTGSNTEQLENIEDRLDDLSDANVAQREAFEEWMATLMNRWSIGIGAVLAILLALALTFTLALRRQRRALGAEISVADAVRAELARLRGEKPPAPAPRPATAKHLVAGRAQLKRLRAEFGSGPITLGASPDCELVVRQSVVSDEHARVGWDRDLRKFWLEDLDSRNGTFLANGARLAAGKRYCLEDGENFFLVHEELGFYVLSPH